MMYFSEPLSPPLSKGGRGDGEGFGVRAVPYGDEKRYSRHLAKIRIDPPNPPDYPPPVPLKKGEARGINI
jgi:hypothetical protein